MKDLEKLFFRLGVLIIIQFTIVASANQSDDPFQRLADREAKVYQWMHTMYDSTSGGVYLSSYIKSIAQERDLGPDIQSTVQFLTIERERLGVRVIPNGLYDNTKLFLKRNREFSGIFAEPYYSKLLQKNSRSFDRIQSFGLKGMVILGADDISKKSMKSINISDMQVRDFLDSIDWTYSYRALDRIQARVSFWTSKGATAQQLNQVFVELTRRLNRNTGMWTSEEQSHDLDGAFKAVLIYSAFNIPVPNCSQLLTSAVESLNHESREPITTALRNPLSIIGSLNSQCHDVTIDIYKLANTVDRRLENYQQLDGGVSYYYNASSVKPNDLDIGLGAKGPMVGDMNGAAQFFECTKALKKLMSDLNRIKKGDIS